MKSFSRNLKAISPIFATLILIAIAVIAGVVVYMFTSGTLASMTGGGTAGQEKVAIQSVDVSGTNGVVYAQNLGGSDITVIAVQVKGASGNLYGTDDLSTTPVTLAPGALSSDVTFTIPLDTGTYTVTLITQAGGSFVSPSFTV